MNLKIGLFGVGLDVYWEQFTGLKSRLLTYLDTVHDHLAAHEGVEIVNLGLIDTVDKAMDAGHHFRQADVELIFIYLSTYALSSTVLPIVRHARVPVVVLNLSPEKAINYNRLTLWETAPI